MAYRNDKTPRIWMTRKDYEVKEPNALKRIWVRRKLLNNSLPVKWKKGWALGQSLLSARPLEFWGAFGYSVSRAITLAKKSFKFKRLLFTKRQRDAFGNLSEREAFAECGVAFITTEEAIAIQAQRDITPSPLLEGVMMQSLIYNK